MKTVNEAMEEILDENDLNITKLNHFIYAAMVITDIINGTGVYKLQTQRSKTPPWVRHIEGSINDIKKELSALVEIRRENRKVMNINRTRLLKKYNIEKTEELDQLIEELTQRFQKRHNDYLDTGKDKTSITKISCLGQTARNFKTALGRRTPM